MQDGVVATRLPLSEVAPDTLRRMLDYWRSKCREGRLPGRRDIDPLEFPWALGLVCLLDVEREPLRFRYRLDGTTIAERHGEDFTGRTTDEVRPDFYAAMLRRHMSEVVDGKLPTCYRISIRYGANARTYVRLALPLARDGVNVDMVLTISDRLPSEIDDDYRSNRSFR
jgi:hypothetical protein